MNEKQIRKKTRKIVIGHYNGMIKHARNIAKSYAVERMPLKLVNPLINLAKLPNKFENENMELFRGRFNDTLELLKDECRKNSNVIGDKCISLTHFIQFIELMKSSFLKGQEQPQTV